FRSRGGRRRPGGRRHVPGDHRRRHRGPPQPGQPRQAGTPVPAVGGHRPRRTGAPPDLLTPPALHVTQITFLSCQETAPCPVQGANPLKTGAGTCSTASSYSEPDTPEPAPPGASPGDCTVTTSPSPSSTPNPTSPRASPRTSPR